MVGIFLKLKKLFKKVRSFLIIADVARLLIPNIIIIMTQLCRNLCVVFYSKAQEGLATSYSSNLLTFTIHAWPIS